jgi:hypothetical protein
MTTFKIWMFIAFLCMTYVFVRLRKAQRVKIEETENFPMIYAGKASKQSSKDWQIARAIAKRVRRALDVHEMRYHSMNRAN